MIEKLLCSDIRRNAISELQKGPAKANAFGAHNPSNAIAAMKPAVKAGLVTHTRGVYTLTNTGKIWALIMQDMIDAEEVLAIPFWQSHDISSIPPDLLAKIGRLKGGTVIMPNGDQLKAQRNFVNVVGKAKDVCGVSSINAPGYEGMITKALQDGSKVSLVLSQAVIETLSPGAVDNWSTYETFRLKIAPNKATFTVADDTLLLALYSGENIDPFQEWAVTSDAAARWGRELFAHYFSN